MTKIRRNLLILLATVALIGGQLASAHHSHDEPELDCVACHLNDVKSASPLEAKPFCTGFEKPAADTTILGPQKIRRNAFAFAPRGPPLF